MVGLGLGLHVNWLGDVFDENLNYWKFVVCRIMWLGADMKSGSEVKGNGVQGREIEIFGV
jgi:hypothetical protein